MENKMESIIPSLICDFYKTSHYNQYPKDTEFLYSTLVPRSNKYLPAVDRVVSINITGFLKKYFVNYFNKFFFERSEDEVVKEYSDFIKRTLSIDDTGDHIRKLHKLAYLPIRVKAIPEGMSTPISVPILTIENTHKEFAWLTNYLETLLSCSLWSPITSASIARQYRMIGEKYAAKTCDNNGHVSFQFHDFSMRGMSSLESAQISGLGHLIYFDGTDNIPAITYVDKYYSGKSAKDWNPTSIPATEHSVMCANVAKQQAEGKGRDETETYRKLITETYPSGFVSIVSDTYDFWHNVSVVIPSLKEEIMARDGRVVIRPDCYSEDTSIFTKNGWKPFKDLNEFDLVAQVLDDGTFDFVKPLKYVKQYYKGDMEHFTNSHRTMDIFVTPNHRMYYERIRKGKITQHIHEAKEFPNNRNVGKIFRRSAIGPNYDKTLSFLERLKIAFQADGSYCSGVKNSIRFSFAKERKIERLKWILDNLSLPYKIYNLSDGKVEFNIKFENAKDEFLKNFSWVDISNLCSNWAKEFLEELMYWDSSIRNDGRFKYDTTVSECAEVVETIAIFAGYGVTHSVLEDNRKEHFSNVHSLHIRHDNRLATVNKETKSYDGYVYCVQVPSSKILVKRNRCTLVCGNSGDPVQIICGIPDSSVSTAEEKGLIEVLWETFGGTVNEKGYKVLDPHIGAIYGDSITLQRAEEIFTRLEAKGFASSNIVMGVGSYSYQGNTRDSLGFAVKATSVTQNGVEYPIQKDPKTDPGKKSFCGRVKVVNDKCIDNMSSKGDYSDDELEVVFENGIVSHVDIGTVRKRALSEI
jgi:nicotinic acid phosphoribosyltransferase